MSDPKRLVDMGDEMGESLRGLRQLAPPDGHADRMADAVTDAFFGGAPPDGDGSTGGDGGGDTASPDVPVDAASPVSPSLSGYTVAGVVAAAAVGGVLYLSQPDATSPETTTPSTTQSAPSSPSAVAPATAAPSSTTSAVEALPTASPSALPTSAQPPPSPTTLPSATATPSASPPSEISLLRDAQTALGSNPQQALTLCQQHATLYPAGALSQEREVIVIEALVRLGRTAEAKSRATAFIAAHPGSTHTRRLEVLTGVSSPTP